MAWELKLRGEQDAHWNWSAVLVSYSKFVWSGIVYNLFKEEWESKKGGQKGEGRSRTDEWLSAIMSQGHVHFTP